MLYWSIKNSSHPESRTFDLIPLMWFQEWDVAGNSRKTFIVDTGGPDGSSGKGGLEPVFSAGATASGTATGGSALATGGRSGGSFISKRKATGSFEEHSLILPRKKSS